uniref:Uncharacterized protein n=1 Tax=Leersia perrieri TaxID=77586 RepID=A0A0D9Y0I7_9ORYZ
MGPLGLTGPLHRLPFFLPHPFAAGAADEAAGNGRRRPISWRISDFRPAGVGYGSMGRSLCTRFRVLSSHKVIRCTMYTSKAFRMGGSVAFAVATSDTECCCCWTEPCTVMDTASAFNVCRQTLQLCEVEQQKEKSVPNLCQMRS